MADPLLPWLERQCPGSDPSQVAGAIADWLERQEHEPWISPAYRITARLLRRETITEN